MRTQPLQGLVVGASDGLRIDGQQPCNFKDVTLLIVKILQDQDLPGRQEAVGDPELLHMAILDTQKGLRHVIDRLGGLAPAPQMVDGAGSRDDGQPGRQAGAGGIVGFQQPEILGAQPDENVLGGIQDVVLAQPVGSEGPAHDGIDQRRSSNDERIPRAFVASGERPQIDLVQFSHATIFLPVRPAV